MEIRLSSLVEGAKKAQGTAIIVDVFPRIHHRGQ